LPAAPKATNALEITSAAITTVGTGAALGIPLAEAA